MRRHSVVLFSAAVLILASCAASAAEDVPPERVTFMSLDGHTTLVGYVFAPQGKEGPRPGVVMMHGRAGAYSTAAKGQYDATTLSRRHRMWGEFWAAKGYVAVLVDGFGPRGYPQGFPRFSYSQRPAELNEITVRPLDAYGGLAYLRARGDVFADRVGLQGWSNGGSAALATMAVAASDAPGADLHTPATGFRAALAFYPACALKNAFDQSGYRPYAPVLLLQGSADEEVSPKRCAALVERSRDQGGDIRMKLYPGATHDFDDPSRAHQKNEANADAKADALVRAQAFFSRHLEGREAR